MMSEVRFRALLICCLLFLPTIVPADNLPSLPASSDIKTGTLDNGIKYYLAVNPKQKGLADVTLVQKAGFGDETPAKAGESVVVSRGSLASLPRFSSFTPFRFLNGKGVFPGKGGYVTVYDDATIYNFDNLALEQSKDALDSTLLMIFDAIERQSSTSDRYSPANQAIIVAGDIDKNAVLNKMNMLSLLVTKKNTSVRRPAYKFTGGETARFEFLPVAKEGAASVIASYRSPRTPAPDMATIQPLVSQKMANELGILVRKRLSNALKDNGIPFSSLIYSYRSSGDGPGDEEFRIGLTTADENLLLATKTLARVLAEIDTHGVTPEEYKSIQNHFISNLSESVGLLWETNARLTHKCLSAYLYGSSLATDKTDFNFFKDRNLPAETGSKLFNNYASAVLDPSRNLTILCNADSTASISNDILRTFDASWSIEARNTERSGGHASADTTSLKKSFPSVKVKNELQEPMTGGKIWTFSNGMTVIYKQADMEGMFSYSFLLKSGYFQAGGLKKEEYAFLDDVLFHFKIAGMSGLEFRNMLSSNGIAMTPEVTVSDITLMGTAPQSKLPLVMKSILAVGYSRSEDPESFSFYRKCLDVFSRTPQFLAEERMASLDSILSPGNNFPSYMRRTSLSDDFPKRADRFFTRAFSKANDGVMIIVGDFPEYELKKQLCKYMGGFKTDNVSTFRSRAQYRTISGLSKKTRAGDSTYLDIAMSSLMNYTAENFMAYNVASLAMRKAIASAAAEAGWNASFEDQFEMFPEERYNLYARLSPSSVDGLPASMVQVNSVDEVASRVNAAISRTGEKGVSNSETSAFKAIVGGAVSTALTSPRSLESMLVLRYSYGKDLMTKYNDKLNSVSASKVNSILALMAKGGIAESACQAPDKSDIVYEAPLQEPVLPDVPEVVPAEDSLGMCRLYRALFLGIPDTLSVPETPHAWKVTEKVTPIKPPKRLRAKEEVRDTSSVLEIRDSSAFRELPDTVSIKEKIDTSFSKEIERRDE